MNTVRFTQNMMKHHPVIYDYLKHKGCIVPHNNLLSPASTIRTLEIPIIQNAYSSNEVMLDELYNYIHNNRLLIEFRLL